MEDGVLAVRPVATLSDEEFAQLADIPPEAEWFANLTNPNTRRAYKSDVRSFMDFLGIEQGQDPRKVVPAQVLAWRKAIAAQARPRPRSAGSWRPSPPFLTTFATGMRSRGTRSRASSAPRRAPTRERPRQSAMSRLGSSWRLPVMAR
jgi:hypothetical protein